MEVKVKVTQGRLWIGMDFHQKHGWWTTNAAAQSRLPSTHDGRRWIPTPTQDTTAHPWRSHRNTYRRHQYVDVTWRLWPVGRNRERREMEPRDGRRWSAQGAGGDTAPQGSPGGARVPPGAGPAPEGDTGEQPVREDRNTNTTHYLRGRHGPCPALLHCVGYQACLFRFSTEFCLRDPYPGTSHNDGTCRELFLVPLPLFHPWIFNGKKLNEKAETELKIALNKYPQLIPSADTGGASDERPLSA